METTRCRVCGWVHTFPAPSRWALLAIELGGPRVLHYLRPRPK